MRAIGVSLLASFVLVTGCAHRLSPAAALADEAAVKIAQGNLTDAEPELKRSIALDPNQPWPHYNLATVLQARRSFRDGLAEYRRALQLFGADRFGKGICLYGIAGLLDDQNEWQPALAAYEEYLTFARNEPREMKGIAMAHARIAIIRDALQRGIPAGKPLRGVALAGSGPAPAAGEAGAAAPAAAPAGPAPAPAPAAKPAPGAKAPAPAPAAKPAAAKKPVR
jgi:tetratricopeptide (TPR) repeat protein